MNTDLILPPEANESLASKESERPNLKDRL